MTRKKDKDGVTRVSASDATKGVKPSESVSEIEKVKGASAVKGVAEVVEKAVQMVIDAALIDNEDDGKKQKK